MVLLPIVERELRAAARNTATYHLRLLAAGALLLATTIFAASYGFAADLGGKLFGALHLTLFAAIWILVPFLTADCISRERREGTLGILFLTPLRAGDLVLAKCLAHSLRALTLWLAVLPLIMVPVLLGGVGWREAVLSGLVSSNALIVALAAGLVASSCSRLWTRVILYATCFSMLGCLLFMVLNAFILTCVLNGLTGGINRLVYFFPENLEGLIGQGVWLATDFDGNWAMFLSRMGTSQRVAWLVAGVCVVLISFLGLLLAIRFVAWRVSRVWHEEPPGARVLWLEDQLCRPRYFQRLFRAWMKAKLERNPVGWLELRSWSGRLVTWGWLGVVTCIYSAFLTGYSFIDPSRDLNIAVVLLLGGSLALSAAGSFRRERETGVLELLLVSPLHEREIVSGRLRGLWGQFLPAILLALGIWLYLSVIFPYSYSSLLMLAPQTRGNGAAILFYASGFGTLPIIGLYFSLLCRNFLTAFLATVCFGLFLPLLIGGFLDSLWDSALTPVPSPSWGPHYTLLAVLSQLVLAAIFWDALHRRLRQRKFPLTAAR